MTQLQPITSREELNILLTQSRDFIAQMTPAERGSLWAAQNLTWLVSEKLAAINEGDNDLDMVIGSLRALRSRVQYNVSLDIKMIENLTVADRDYVIEHINDAIEKVKALITQAA